MQLPRLKVIQDQVIPLSKCDNGNACKSCKLYVKNGGRCSGCSIGKREQMKLREDNNFLSCYKQCHECTGYKAHITGVCCRSPLKDIYMNAAAKGQDWNNVRWNFTKRPALKFKQRAVLNLVFGSPTRILQGTNERYMLPESTEIVATSLSFVSGFGSGFFSKDLKAYLRMPPKAKLMLSTMSIDDHLERAWDHERYGSPDCEAANIDYWMPLAFSSYSYEANMHMYFQFLRTLYSAEKGKAWFFPGDVPRVNIKLDDILQQGMEAMPQVIFNVQFNTTKDDLVSYVANLKWWHKFAPKDVSFWLVGATTPEVLHNIRKVCGARDLYWLSGKPMYNAVNGKELLTNGREAKVDVNTPKRDILQRNMQVFEEMVRRYG